MILDKTQIEDSLQVLKAILVVSIPGIFFYFFLWQNIRFTLMEKELKQLNMQKETLIKKNDDLKIGITTYTSAKRIEALYRKTYNYLPISIGKRIETVILPPERQNEAE